jgi:KDO2-lipid IV(A) lauroyltransferase
MAAVRSRMGSPAKVERLDRSMGDGPGKVKPRKRGKRGGQTVPRDYLEYAGLRIAVVLIRAVPVHVAAAVMGWLWRVFGPRTERHRRVLENLAIAFPQLDAVAREQIAAEQWENLGRTSAESFHTATFAADPALIEFDPGPAMEALLRRPGGKVFVSMHSGNWEVGALPVQRYHVLAGLYQTIKNPLVDRYVAGLRLHVFPGGLFTKGVKTPGHIMNWIRAGNAVGMLVDHRESRGVDVTVFGQPAKANPFPAMVARRLGVPLIAGRSIRLRKSRFRVELAEVEVPVTDDPHADVAVATQAIQDQFEAWIRERPGEWMWVQDRWREVRRSGGVTVADPACHETADESVSRG